MNYNPILIVSGEPNSIFFEILFKVLKKNKVLSPIILISSNKLLNLQMKGKHKVPPSVQMQRSKEREGPQVLLISLQISRLLELH